MELLLVRHAIAFERDAKRWPDDAQRPLTPEGIARARKAAVGLKRLIGRPRRVLTSPLVRAQQTAEILARSAGWPRARVCPELEPGGSPEALIEALRREPAGRIAVIGHEPDLSVLIAACLPGRVRPAAFRMRKFGVAELLFEGAPRPQRGTLSYLLPPRLLRSAR